MKDKYDLIFDLDGTLLDAWQRLYTAYQQVLFSFEESPLPFLQYKHIVRFHQGHTFLLKQTNISPEIYVSEYRKIIESEELLLLDTLYENVQETLKTLAQTHTLHLLTKRQEKERTLNQLKRLNIFSFFSSYTINASATKSELVPSIVSTNQNVFIIGDTEEDIEAGEKNGIKTIFATYGLRDETMFQKNKYENRISSIQELMPLLS